MEKISCEVIGDLLPLYCDDVCSQGSRELVERHLEGCPDCRRLLGKMRVGCHTCTKQEQQGEELMKNMATLWKKSVFHGFLKGLGAAVCLLALLFAGYWGLVRWPTVAVPSDAVKASADVSGQEFTICVETTDGYKAPSMDLEVTEDGKVFLVFLRGAIPVKNVAGTNQKDTYSGSVVQRASESGKMVRVKEIYYGTKGDSILLWKETLY